MKRRQFMRAAAGLAAAVAIPARAAEKQYGVLIAIESSTDFPKYAGVKDMPAKFKRQLDGMVRRTLGRMGQCVESRERDYIWLPPFRTGDPSGQRGSAGVKFYVRKGAK